VPRGEPAPHFADAHAGYAFREAATIETGRLFCVIAALVLASPAAAQMWPEKPIKLIVPFSAGGPIDTMARFVAQPLSARLGQSVIIENRPGGGSTIAAKAVATAEPDGYTLLFASSGSLAVAPALYRNLDYDPQRSFVPIATTASLPHLLVVRPDLPARSVAEFVAYAKAHPGKLNYGAALATPPHLLSTLFKHQAGIEVVYVPYKGSAPALTDLLAGATQWTIDALTTGRQGRPAAAAGGGERAALAGAAAGPNPDRERLCGFLARRLERRGGAGRHAGAGGGQAQRADQRVLARRRGDGGARQALRAAEDRDAGGFRGIHRVGEDEVGGRW
jgi:Tripartite tricarboxylate transporter family receptor